MGVIPAQSKKAIAHAGNTSLRGAAAIALEPSLSAVAQSLIDCVEFVDLAVDPEFATQLMKAVALEPYET